MLLWGLWIWNQRSKQMAKDLAVAKNNGGKPIDTAEHQNNISVSEESGDNEKPEEAAPSSDGSGRSLQKNLTYEKRQINLIMNKGENF